MRGPGMAKTRSEALFEAFLTANSIPYEPVPTVPDAQRPDYRATLGAVAVLFEVKELTENSAYDFETGPGACKINSSTLGDHIRGLITRSKKQIQYGAKQGIPSVLVVYNNMDPFQLLGTGPQDFEAAMYGA